MPYKAVALAEPISEAAPQDFPIIVTTSWASSASPRQNATTDAACRRKSRVQSIGDARTPDTIESTVTLNGVDRLSRAATTMRRWPAPRRATLAPPALLRRAALRSPG